MPACSACAAKDETTSAECVFKNCSPTADTPEQTNACGAMSRFRLEPDRSPVSAHQQAVLPLSYYEQLAEAGALYDFLQTNMHERFDADPAFRADMLRILLDRSQVVLPEVEWELLSELSTALEVFFTAVEQCHSKHRESL